MRTDQETENRISRKGLFVSIVSIVLMGAIAYGNSLDGKFVWDDNSLVKNNSRLTGFSQVKMIFSENVEAGSGTKTSFYRPVQTLTYMLDHRLWGLNEKGYHITNTVLHVSVALLIFWLVNILFHSQRVALLTGLFFVAHPVQTEAVSYISGRAEPLSALFLLLAFVLYVKSLKARNAGLIIGTILSYIAALLSKENSIVFPAILLLYHFSFKEKIRPGDLLSVLGITAAYVLLRVTLLKDLLTYISYNPDAAVVSTTVLQRIPRFFVAVAKYLKLLIFPLDLHMEYGNNLFEFTDGKVILGIMMVLGSLVYAFRRKRKDRLLFFSVTWFYVALLPVSNIYPINAYMAEHWLYLPSVGFFLVLSHSFDRFYQERPWRVLAAAMMVILLASLTFLTREQNGYWRDPITFYKRTLQYAPDSHRLYCNLGNAYNVDGKIDEAIGAYQKSIAVNQTGNSYAEPYNGLGVAYYHLGNVEQAVRMLKKAVGINPTYTEAYYNLGQMYKILNEGELSVAAFEKAVQLNPDFPKAHYELAKSYYLDGRYDLAVRHSDLAAGLGVTIEPVFSKKLEPYRSQWAVSK